jgi:hypothetical protein
MTDDDLLAELGRLSQPAIEGKVPYMYQDNADPPNVTCGVGFLLSGVEAAQALPWRRAADESPASPDEVAREFLRVHSMRGGLSAKAYHGSLVLAPDDVTAEGLRRLRLMVTGLQREFPAFDGFPGQVQQALLDLRWNAGSLMRWTHLRQACNSVPPDWQAASEQCTVANPDNLKLRALRNQWRQSCFTSQLGTG